MLVLALVIARPDPTGSLVAAGAFVACNGVGSWLWMQRERWSMYRALQTLLVVLAVATAVVAVVVNQGGAYASPCWILVIYPALMGMFRIREARAVGVARA